MKSPVQIQAELSQTNMELEAHYVVLRELVGKELLRVKEMRGAMASFEAKLERAVAEFSQETKTINDNFDRSK